MNTYEIWKNEVINSLKGECFEKKLTSKTYENIEINPLYASNISIFDKNLYPGLNDRIRGSKIEGYFSKPYLISENIYYDNYKAFNSFIDEFISTGIDEINLKFKNNIETKDLENIFKIMLTNNFNLKIDNNFIQIDVFNKLNTYLKSNNVSDFKANFLIDIFKILNFNNYNIEDLNQKLYDNYKLFYEFKNIKTIGIDVAYYQEAGGTAVHELSLALASFVYYIEYFKAKNEDIKNIFNKVSFNFSIGSNFFMEIAKFRAFRALWSNVIKAYNYDPDNYHCSISSNTSSFNKSVLDAHTNVLRASTEALSAVLGGVDALNISSYDSINNVNNKQSFRIAKNIGLILKEECNLLNIIDPVSGSYYIDYLTKELINKAWTLFCDIEDEGGIFSSLKNNTIKTLIYASYQEKFNNFSKRKDTLIGVNIYPNYNDKILNLEPELSVVKNDYFNSVIPSRISKPYEELNYYLNLYNKNNKNPFSILQINYGETNAFKVRADWLSSFFQVLRFNMVNTLNFKNETEIIGELKNNNYHVAVIVATDEEYPKFVTSLVKKIKDIDKNLYVFLAGQAKDFETEWLNAGLNDFINIKTNHYEFLKKLLKQVGVMKNE